MIAEAIANGDPVAGGIEHQSLGFDDFLIATLRRAAQHCIDPRQQFAR